MLYWSYTTFFYLIQLGKLIDKSYLIVTDSIQYSAKEYNTKKYNVIQHKLSYV